MQAREALRDLQSRLSERLQSSAAEGTQAQWLAVRSGAQSCLLPMRLVGEIFAALAPVPVPYARPWFLGVANLRGGLYGVADLQRLLASTGLPLSASGVATTAGRERLVTLNPELACNAALRVDDLLGMRRADAFSAHEDTGHAWVPRRWIDAQQQPWLELDLRALADSADFLTVVG